MSESEHFVVVVRTTLDDLPIALATVKADAEAIISRMTLDDIRRSARKMKVDYASIVNVAILRFVDGAYQTMSLRDLPGSVERALEAEAMAHAVAKGQEGQPQ